MTPSPAQQSAEITKEIDRCAYLLAREAADKPWHKELTILKAKLQADCTSLPANQPVHLEGALYYLDLTQRELKREITHPRRAFNALRKAIGLIALVKRLTITFKLLDSEIAAADQAKYVTSARTGSRDISGGLIVVLVPAAV